MIHNKQSGIIALTAVLIVGAIVLVVAIGVATRTMVETNISLSEEYSNRALVAATSCMESALAKLSDSSSYAGNENLSVGTDSCTVATVVVAGSMRTVKTTSTIGGYTRRLSATIININTVPLQVSSWQEVDN